MKLRFKNILSLIVFFMILLGFTNVQAFYLKTGNQENDNDILTVDLGSMKMEYIDNPDKNYIKISFNTPSRIDDTIFEIGQTIRLQVSWEIVEDGIRQDYWNFSIARLRLHYGCGSWATVFPDNPEGWYKEVFDKAGNDDSSNGKLYFDFTPSREWFCSAWHNIGGDSEEFINSILLRCEYKSKSWIGFEWTTTIEEDKLEDNWYLAYQNTAPSITNHDLSKDGKTVRLEMDVSDPDFRPSSGKGDYIGVTIDWGDGTKTDTGYWDNKAQIMNGATTTAKSHTYERVGRYTITAKVKDWYNAGFHEYSNEITREVEIELGKTKNLDFHFFYNFIKQFPFFEKIMDSVT